MYVLKYAASNHGIESLGVIGQLLSMTALLALIANAGIGRAVTHRHAEFRGVAHRIDASNASVAVIAGVTAGITSLSVFAAAPLIAEVVFGDRESASVLRILAIAVPFLAVNGILISAAAAHQRSAMAAKAQIIGALLAAALLTLTGSHGLSSILYLLAGQSLIYSIVMLFAFGRKFWEESRLAPRTIVRALRSRPPLRRELIFMASFAATVYIPVLMRHTTFIVGRIIIDESQGPVELGLWEAVVKLQEGYLQLFGTVLTLILLPALVVNGTGRPRLVRHYTVQGTAILSIALLASLVGGAPLLRLLYAPSAVEAAPYLTLMLLGDACRFYFAVNQFRLLAEERFFNFIALEGLMWATALLSIVAGLKLGNLTMVFTLWVVQGMLVSIASLLTVRVIERESQRSLSMTVSEGCP